MSGKEVKINVEVSQMLYNLEYDALIKRKAAARKKREEEEKKAREKDGGSGK
jgi:hypothetical protein